MLSEVILKNVDRNVGYGFKPLQAHQLETATDRC